MDMMESMIHPALGSEAHKYRRDMQISIPEDQDEHVYPPEAVQVRNTFIHVATPDHGLDDASKHVYSCPASHMGWPEPILGTIFYWTVIESCSILRVFKWFSSTFSPQSPRRLSTGVKVDHEAL